MTYWFGSLILRLRPGSPCRLTSFAFQPRHESAETNAGIKRQEWRKSSNPRQAAPCSANTILSIREAGVWRMLVNGGI
jgi:hypothetical protein